MAVTYDFQTPDASTTAADTLQDIRNIAEMSWVWHVNSTPHTLSNKPTGLIEAFYTFTEDFTSTIPSYGKQGNYTLQSYDGSGLTNVNFQSLYVRNNGAVLSNTIGTRGLEYIGMGVVPGYFSESESLWRVAADINNDGNTTFDVGIIFSRYTTATAKIYTDTSDSDKLKFDVGGTDWMTIDSSGNSSFYGNIAISSASTGATQFSIDNTDTGSNGNWAFNVAGGSNGLSIAAGHLYISSAGTANDFIVRTQASEATETFRILGSNGNVGIGTLPDEKFHVEVAATNVAAKFGASSSGDAIAITPLAAGNGGIIGALNDALSDFEPMALYAESIDLNYRTGVGTVTAGLTLASTGVVSVTNQFQCAPISSAPTGSLADGQIYYNTTTNKLQVRASGAWVDLH